MMTREEQGEIAASGYAMNHADMMLQRLLSNEVILQFDLQGKSAYNVVAREQRKVTRRWLMIDIRVTPLR